MSQPGPVRTPPILVPLDGSEKDDRGLAAALALARLSGAPLRLVHVGAGPDAAAELERIARAVPAAQPVVAAMLPGDADPAAALVQHARETQAIAMVMATRAPGAVDRVLHPSVADAVMRESPCAVVLVPPGTDYMRDKAVQFGRVLVPLDGSDLADRALDYLLALPHAVELEYALLTVVPPQAERETARERLAAVAGRVRAAGVRSVEFDVCETAHPADAIGAAVRESLVDLIAMSSRGQGGLRRLVVGSVAEAVVRESEVPVLLLTPRSLGGGA